MAAFTLDSVKYSGPTTTNTRHSKSCRQAETSLHFELKCVGMLKHSDWHINFRLIFHWWIGGSNLGSWRQLMNFGIIFYDWMI